MSEENNPVTPLDIVNYALKYALKQQIITHAEERRAFSFVRDAHDCCRNVLAEQKGPVNCSPLGLAKDALGDFVQYAELLN